jgi:nonribosomal peptide synthetase DhbF
VVVRDDDAGQRRLVAYVVAAGGSGTGPSAEELRQFAAARLPEFLVPLFVLLKRLPVTADGRVDPASLPEPEFGDGKYQAPRNHTEQVLADAFAEVLEVARVGIDEDFFDLGGNSLRAIRLVGLIRTELKLEVSIRALFAARTVIGLSGILDDLSKSSRPALRRRTREGAMV